MARVSLADKARQVKPFVNFKVNLTRAKQGTLTASEKRKINQYHKVLYGYAYKDSDGKQHYQPGLATGLKYPIPLKDFKTDADKSDAIALSGQPHLKGLTHVFFDTTQGKSGKLLKPKIRRSRNGDLSYEVNHVRFGFIPFNMRALAKNPEGEIDKALGSHSANAWLIKCGEWESRQQESRSTVKAKVLRWMDEYKKTYRKWLFGLVPMEFTRQKAFREYRKHRDDTLKSRGKVKKDAKPKKGRRKRNG